MTTTLPASLVLDALGRLPDMWHGCGSDRDWVYGVPGTDIESGDVLNLTDHQTAFGLTLLLDEWERAGRGVEETWTERLAYWAVTSQAVPVQFLQAMTGRIEHIGLDARIRRALGWPVEAGTLATLTSAHDGHQWRFSDGVSHHGFFAKGRVNTGEWTIVPGLLFATTLEARRAIAAEVC